MDIIGFIVLIIGALTTFLAGMICRKLGWDDSPTSFKLLGIKIVGFAVSFIGVLFVFGLFG